MNKNCRNENAKRMYGVTIGRIESGINGYRREYSNANIKGKNKKNRLR